MLRTARAPSGSASVSSQTNPSTYPGTASGVTSSQPSTRRPRNSYAVTSQASAVPSTSVPASTATDRVTVSRSMPGSLVRQSWRQIAVSGSVSDQATTVTGAANAAATAVRAAQPGSERVLRVTRIRR